MPTQRFPKPPRLPKQTKYIQLPDPRVTPSQVLPKDAEADRQARWQAFSAVRNASYPEFIVYEYLTTRKKMREGYDFIFQYGIAGGRTFLGGVVLDFYFRDRALGFAVQGLRYHAVQPQQRVRDQLAKVILRDFGIEMIELFEDDIIVRTVQTIEQGLRGIQISRGLLNR